MENFLNKLRSDWRKTIEGDGGTCPCCDRWGRVYGRGINKTMARSLIWLAHHSQGEKWVDVPLLAPRWLVRSNQLPTLRWWGLVQRLDTDDPQQKHSGFWRATTLGLQFAANEVQVPKKAFTYNAAVEYFGEEMVRISDCVERFSYEDVMRS